MVFHKNFFLHSVSTWFLSLLFLPLTSCAYVSNREAIKLCAENKIDDAIAEYNRLLRIYPDDDCLLSNLAICAMNKGRIDVAEKAIHKLTTLGSASYAYHKTAGELAYKRGENKLAKEHLDRAVQLEERGRDFYLLARIAKKTGSDDLPYWEKAFQLYQRESKEESFSAMKWTDFASVAYGSGNLEESLAGFENALRLDPNYERAKKDIIKVKEKIASKGKTGLTLVILLDKSSSMGINTDYQKLKESVVTFVSSLKDDDFVSLVGFDSTSFVIAKLANAKTVKESLPKRIAMLIPKLRSSLSKPLDDSANILKTSNGPNKRICIITDGHIGDGSKVNYLEKIKAVRKLDITTSVILLGKEKPTIDFQELSKLGGGTFRLVNSLDELPDVMKSSCVN